MKLSFLGPPASGKGTYASRIAPIFGIPHISPGALFREMGREGTELGKKVKAIIDSGDLIPDDLTVQVIKERISKPDCKNGFIFDGFPRTIPQAEALEKIAKMDAIVNMSVPESVIMDRIVYRVACEKCGAVFNTRVLKPKKEGICDDCGHELKGRADQTPEAVKERLKVYYEKSEPVNKFYKDRNMLIDIYNDKADIDVQIMIDRIIDELKKRGILDERELKLLAEAQETERTLVVIKPDGVERGMVEEIIKRYEKAGLKIVKRKKLTVDKEFVKKHYPDSMAKVLGSKAQAAGAKIDNLEEHGKKVLGWLRGYISSGPVVALIIEGKNAIKRVREVTGYTDPATAEKGTIRGDLGNDSILKATEEGRVVYNLIHASGNKEEAEAEIKLWFG